MSYRPEWITRAACAGIVDDLGFDPFYPADTGHNYRPAKLICGSCPVISDCLSYALHHAEHGIWGGATEEERRELRKQLGITAVTTRPHLQPCGTRAGSKAHSRRGEPPCIDCRIADRRNKAAHR